MLEQKNPGQDLGRLESQWICGVIFIVFEFKNQRTLREFIISVNQNAYD